MARLASSFDFPCPACDMKLHVPITGSHVDRGAAGDAILWLHTDVEQVVSHLDAHRASAVLVAASQADARAFKAELADDDAHVIATITPRSMLACRGITASTIIATPEAKAHPKYADMLAEAQICTLANATVR